MMLILLVADAVVAVAFELAEVVVNAVEDLVRFESWLANQMHHLPQNLQVPMQLLNIDGVIPRHVSLALDQRTTSP